MKKIFGILILVLVLAYPAATFATTSNAPAAVAIRGFCGIDSSQLTTQQKADLLSSFKSVMSARKAAIGKAVQDGTITKEQGVATTNRIDAMIKYREENGFNGSCGKGAGGSGGGCYGAGNCNGARNGLKYQVY